MLKPQVLEVENGIVNLAEVTPNIPDGFEPAFMEILPLQVNKRGRSTGKKCRVTIWLEKEREIRWKP